MYSMILEKNIIFKKKIKHFIQKKESIFYIFFRKKMSYLLSRAKEYALKGIDQFLKFDLRESEAFVTNHTEDYVTSQALDLLFKTRDIDPIPRYFIIDAVLSNRFHISLDQAEFTWQQELDYAQKLHESIQSIAKKDSIPRVYQCARFALHILKHLMQRGFTETMVTHTDLARNFIVGLTTTQQCLCLSYTLYVQAIVNHFGYDDYISECLVPGHIFTLTNAKDDTKNSFMLGFDAGFFENSYIMVENWGSHHPYTMDQVKQMIDWDPKFFGLIEQKNNIPQCQQQFYWGRNKKTQNSHVTGMLWLESSGKKTNIKRIRNRIILLMIFEELNDYSNLQVAIAFAKRQVEIEIREFEALTAFFDRNNFIPPQNRLIEYDKIRIKKDYAIILSNKNANLTITNYNTANRELICAKNLLVLFEPYIKLWSAEQMAVLCEINAKYANIIKENAKFIFSVAEHIITQEFKISFEINFKYEHIRVDLFRVQYVKINQSYQYFEDCKKSQMKQVLYCHPSLISYIPLYALQKFTIVKMESMDSSLFIITFDFPDKEAKYLELVKKQEETEQKLLDRIQKIKTDVKHNEKYIQTEIKAISDKFDKLVIIEPHYIPELIYVTKPVSTILKERKNVLKKSTVKSTIKKSTIKKRETSKNRELKNTSSRYNLRSKKIIFN